MNNRLGIRLNRLIKERAYLGGAIGLLTTELASIKGLADTKASKLAKASARLDELDKLITELSAIMPDDICQIREKRRRVKGEHGSLILELMKILQLRDAPVETSELVAHIVDKYSFPMSNTAERRSARNAVNGPLNKLRKHGVVVRLPSLSDSQCGRWQWCGQTAQA